MSLNECGFERLPTIFRPQIYDLEICPNFSSFSFFGKLQINILLTQCTDYIVLNARKLNITAAKVRHSATGSTLIVPDNSIEYDEKHEKVKIKFATVIEKGEIDLCLDYNGVVVDDMHGFYRSTYKDCEGVKHTILSTQFEPTYARRAFPCFDEPDMKAKFRISIIIPDHLTALSCMPEASRKPMEIHELQDYGLPTSSSHNNNNTKYVKVNFSQTPLMSTYIVAFVIGSFDHIAAVDSNGVQIRVYTPPGRSHCGMHALKVAKHALPFYTEIFGTEYPLPKLDLIAIPDFAMGAMENWGLVTYRETSLLVDETSCSLASRRNIALTVAHEIAHMWFGNLVTMAWWTHLWLNEGFATWIEYLAVDRCLPDYDIWTVFLTAEFYAAMATDGLKTSHPIEVEVSSPDEIDEIFDAVSYEKGSSIIRMINDYLGKEKFNKGLQHYIQRHKYGNTTTDDLWAALSETCGEDMQAIMSTWTRQTGFPVLTVRQVRQSVEDGLEISIEQNRFLIDGGSDSSEWYVPVTICDAEDSSKVLKRVMLPPTARTQPFTVQLPSEAKIRLNPGAVGFYRVHYVDGLFSNILTALEKKLLNHHDRLCVLADIFSLARAGRTQMVSALNLASKFCCENDYTVWCELSIQLRELRRLIQEKCATCNSPTEVEPVTPFEEALNRFIIYLADAPFKRLGWDAREKEPGNDTLLRSLLIAMLGASGSPEVTAEAKARFDRHYRSVMSSNEGNAESVCKDLIPPDLRVAVYSTCMRLGGVDVYERLLNLYERATVDDERVRLLHCVGCTRVAEVVKRVIGLAFSDLVRKQDRMRPLMSLALASATGRRAVWLEIKQRIDTLVDDLGACNLMSSVITTCCEGFCSDMNCAEVDAFFKQHPVPCSRAVQQALETIAINTRFMEKDGDCVSRFLIDFANSLDCKS